jgi:hypothetical protein
VSGDIVEHLVANAWKRQLEMPVSTHHLLHRAADEIERLQGIQRAVVALARTVLGKSEHPVERSPWIDVIHMMDEEARRER